GAVGASTRERAMGLPVVDVLTHRTPKHRGALFFQGLPVPPHRCADLEETCPLFAAGCQAPRRVPVRPSYPSPRTLLPSPSVSEPQAGTCSARSTPRSRPPSPL